MDDTVAQCMQYLSKHFPRTLDEFRALDNYVPPEFDDCDAITVINLARLTGATHLLPVAILICCRYLSGTELVNGVQHCDGSRDVLSPTDLALCFDAKSRLHRAYIERVARRCPPTPPEDAHRSCYSATRRILNDAIYSAGVTMTCNPFAKLYPTPEVKKALCAHCWDVLKKCDERLMGEAWDRLPALTGVDPMYGWARMM
ncbi:hypothetical protein L226DRAFT_614671 [Lentinus tigrinus ALCF2SS1-7]|nr:hypothetical protein L226DRAFT_614671 [Lentinus tigrinus ALCF2SS1-7]